MFLPSSLVPLFLWKFANSKLSGGASGESNSSVRSAIRHAAADGSFAVTDTRRQGPVPRPCLEILRVDVLGRVKESAKSSTERELRHSKRTEPTQF